MDNLCIRMVGASEREVAGAVGEVVHRGGDAEGVHMGGDLS
jgi:hypothetical protein